MTTPPPRLLLAAAWLAMLTGLATPAAAHAVLVASTPAVGGRTQAGSVALTLRYNSPIDRTRSRLTLTRPDHSQAVLPIAPDTPPDTLAAQATLAPGAY